MTRTNPQSAEFWQGYRDGMTEIYMLGIEAFEAKYSAEFEENVSLDFRGRKKAVKECKRRLAAMLRGRQ